MAMEVISSAARKREVARLEERTKSEGRARVLKEWIIERIIFAHGLVSVLLVALILLFLLRDTLPFFRTVSLWAFLTGREWYPLFDTPS